LATVHHEDGSRAISEIEDSVCKTFDFNEVNRFWILFHTCKSNRTIAKTAGNWIHDYVKTTTEFPILALLIPITSEANS